MAALEDIKARTRFARNGPVRIQPRNSVEIGFADGVDMKNSVRLGSAGLASFLVRVLPTRAHDISLVCFETL